MILHAITVSLIGNAYSTTHCRCLVDASSDEAATSVASVASHHGSGAIGWRCVGGWCSLDSLHWLCNLLHDLWRWLNHGLHFLHDGPWYLGGHLLSDSLRNHLLNLLLYPLHVCFWYLDGGLLRNHLLNLLLYRLHVCFWYHGDALLRNHLLNLVLYPLHVCL